MFLKETLQKSVLVVIGLFVSLLVFETGYRLYINIANPPYIYKPYCALPNPGGSGYRNGKHITFDSNGLRNHNLQEYGARGRTILLVGDSVAFGLNVNDDETIQYYLNQEYEGTDITFVNVSRPGWGTKILKSLLLNYMMQTDRSVDAVIWLYNINDARANWTYVPYYLGEDFTKMAEHVEWRHEKTIVDTLSEITWPYMKSLAYISFKYSKLLALMKNGESTYGWENFYTSCLESYEPDNPKSRLEKRFLDEVLSETQGTGIPIFFVVLPYLDQFSDNRTLPQEFLHGVLGEKVQILDIFPILKQEKDVTIYYPPGDNGHFNSAGYKFIATTIKEHLHPEQYLLQDFVPSQP